MKAFNQTIQIEIEVDAIAHQLLGIHAGSEFPHVELLVESIIGSVLESGHIGLIYNAMHGYKNELDFKVGQLLNCSEDIYSHVRNAETERYEEKRRPMGECIVKDINIYRRSDQVLVTFPYTNSKGESKEQERWVNKKNLKSVEGAI